VLASATEINSQSTQLLFSLQLRTSYKCEAHVPWLRRRKLSSWAWDLITQAVHSSPPLVPIWLLVHHQITQFQVLGWAGGGGDGNLVLLPSITRIELCTSLNWTCLWTVFLETCREYTNFMSNNSFWKMSSHWKGDRGLTALDFLPHIFYLIALTWCVPPYLVSWTSQRHLSLSVSSSLSRELAFALLALFSCLSEVIHNEVGLVEEFGTFF